MPPTPAPVGSCRQITTFCLVTFFAYNSLICKKIDKFKNQYHYCLYTKSAYCLFLITTLQSGYINLKVLSCFTHFEGFLVECKKRWYFFYSKSCGSAPTPLSLISLFMTSPLRFYQFNLTFQLREHLKMIGSIPKCFGHRQLFWPCSSINMHIFPSLLPCLFCLLFTISL